MSRYMSSAVIALVRLTWIIGNDRSTLREFRLIPCSYRVTNEDGSVSIYPNRKSYADSLNPKVGAIISDQAFWGLMERSLEIHRMAICPPADGESE
jgi:hypothetical protein